MPGLTQRHSRRRLLLEGQHRKPADNTVVDNDLAQNDIQTGGSFFAMQTNACSPACPEPP